MSWPTIHQPVSSLEAWPYLDIIINIRPNTILDLGIRWMLVKGCYVLYSLLLPIPPSLPPSWLQSLDLLKCKKWIHSLKDIMRQEQMWTIELAETSNPVKQSKKRKEWNKPVTLQGLLLEGTESTSVLMSVRTQQYSEKTATQTREAPAITIPAMLADDSGVPESNW